MQILLKYLSEEVRVTHDHDVVVGREQELTPGEW
jgi:hypothetical protein